MSTKLPLDKGRENVVTVANDRHASVRCRLLPSTLLPTLCLLSASTASLLPVAHGDTGAWSDTDTGSDTDSACEGVLLLLPLAIPALPVVMAASGVIAVTASGSTGSTGAASGVDGAAV